MIFSLDIFTENLYVNVIGCQATSLQSMSPCFVLVFSETKIQEKTGCLRKFLPSRQIIVMISAFMNIIKAQSPMLCLCFGKLLQEVTKLCLADPLLQPSLHSTSVTGPAGTDEAANGETGADILYVQITYCRNKKIHFFLLKNKRQVNLVFYAQSHLDKTKTKQKHENYCLHYFQESFASINELIAFLLSFSRK